MRPHEVLNVARDASPEEIRAAYSAKVIENHPDHGGDGSQLRALKTARDKMLDGGTSEKKSDCKVCGGKGWVRGSGFKPERCPRRC